MSAPCIVFGMNTMFAVRKFLPEILDMLRQRGMRPVVVAPGSVADVSDLAKCGIELRCVPLKREISPCADLLSLWRIWWVLRAIRPQVTNMSTPKMALLGGLAAWLAGVQHRIYTLRGLRYETARGWKRRLLVGCERIACGCAHQVICISRSVRHTAIRDRVVTEERAVLLGERVSEGLSRRRMSFRGRAEAARSMRDQLGIHPESTILGFVGRLTRDKGVGELAQAFRLLREEGRCVELLLVGTFETGDPVAPEIIEWLQGRNDVHWTGYLADPGPCFELMDIFVFPTYREGLGMVLLEAAAAAKPVVSTRTTGVVDVVLDGTTGLLVPAGDAEAVAHAVGRLLDDPAMAARMGAAARELVGEHFDNTYYLNRLGDVLRGMVDLPVPTAHA